MRLIAIALALVLPVAASAAAATYTTPTGTSAKIVCGSGTCDAPTLSSQGLDLQDLQGYVVTVAADAPDKTLTGTGTLLCYVYDAEVGAWSRLPDLDITVSTGSIRVLSFTGIWVAAARGRVAYVPSSVAVSSGGVTIYLAGTKRVM